MAEEKEIGKITHYYTNIGVAVIELTKTLEAGNQIHIKGQTSDFSQTVGSMQFEHKAIDKANAKQSVGLKVDEQVREGDKVYLAA